MSEQPITLYFDLEPGQKADLEVAARAAIAWSRAIKELAFLIVPETEIAIELRSGSESSLGLNALIRALKRRVPRERLKLVAKGLALFFLGGISQYALEQGLDAIFDPSGDELRLTPDELAAILRAAQSPQVQVHIVEVYREIEREPAIKAVGVTTEAGTRPSHLVPREEFVSRSRLPEPVVETSDRRSRKTGMEAILIRPVLSGATDRKWRFHTEHGEQSFVMADDEFLARTRGDGAPLPMVAGLRMHLEVTLTEDLIDGVWHTNERRIDRVSEIRRPLKPSLFGSLGEPKDGENDD